MRCDPEQVTAYVDGELAPRLAVEIGRHLAACPICAAQATFEIELGERLHSLGAGRPDPRLAGRILQAARFEALATAN